jgi:putative oxidoreductase
VFFFAPMNKWSPLVLSILRIITGFLFIAHGAQKLFSYPAAAEHAGPPPEGLMAVLAPLSGPIEFFGGALIILGLFTRWAAFLLSGEMAVAYFTVHAKGSFWPLLNHGEAAVLYCFVFLYLVFAGGGPLSLDGLIRKKA